MMNYRDSCQQPSVATATDAACYESLNDRGFKQFNPCMQPYQQDSLFTLTLYPDASDPNYIYRGSIDEPVVRVQPNARSTQQLTAQAPAAKAFFSIDEYKDLSLKEILEISDDFILDDDSSHGANTDDDPLTPSAVFQNQPSTASTMVTPTRQMYRLEPCHSFDMEPAPYHMHPQVVAVTPATYHYYQQQQAHAHYVAHDPILRSLALQYEQQQAAQQQRQQHAAQQEPVQTPPPRARRNPTPSPDVVSKASTPQPDVVSKASNYKSKRIRNVFEEAEDEDDSASIMSSYHDEDDVLLETDLPGATPHRYRSYQKGQWSIKYDELCAYREKFGNCLVHHTYENIPLARWVKRQRYQYKLMLDGKQSTMSKERVAALDRIGFVWDSQGASWYDRLDELRAFKSTHGHCNVPSNYEKNTRLAAWVKCQRRQYRLFQEGKPNNITQLRIIELEKLGFEWELRSNKRPKTSST